MIGLEGRTLELNCIGEVRRRAAEVVGESGEEEVIGESEEAIEE